MGAPMDVERRARRPCSDKTEELGPGGDKKPAKTARPSPEDAAAPKPKETSERAKKSSPPPPEDVGARGSVEASPVRDAPTDELGSAAPPPHKKSKKKKKRKRRPPPPSQKVRAQEEVDSGDPLLVSKVPVDASVSLQREIVSSLDHNKRDATPPPKRAKRGATPQQEEEEQAEKSAAGADDVEIGKTLTVTCVPADKVNQLWKVLAGPPHPDSTELGLTGNREEALDACNTSSPEEDSAQEEEQQGEEKMVEQDHDGITSLLQLNDDAHKEKQQGEEVAEQEHSHNASLPQQNGSAQEVEHTGVEVCREALSESNVWSPKLCTSKGEKKPAVERSWSQDDELNILTALVEHAQSHGGALPNSSDLLVKLTFDKTDANADKLNDKIRKLRTRYRRLSSQGRPTDHRGRQLFELSEALWGQVDDDGQAEATFVTRDREFSQRSSLYPYLAEEVKVYAEKHSSGNSIMAAFTTIADDTARHLDAMCKKQRVDAFNLELRQAKLTNAVLSAFSNLIN